eukprot:TRINITY_DN3036_c0_g4_i1.p1 TRINITY_DN3036_c0_g4~~TRINITY_DN3036_c0_g4_i1.p1  ORF type:complete len:1748 (-),score=359.16 TRINITY_DN3036_c0_g4_i1:118-5361(-)
MSMAARSALLIVCGLVGAAAKAKLECSGYEEEWGHCPDLPSCESCKPRDCQFGDWADWYEAGGCAQIKFRHRSIVVENNECGTPCTGPKIESAESPSAECQLPPKDCLLGHWEDWTPCAPGTKQSFRAREVLQHPANGGKPCNGTLKETRFCKASLPVPSDCATSEWQEWTTCSATCGEGQHERMRRIISDANSGGAACNESLQEVATCTLAPCAKQDCLLDPWGPWSACDVGSTQRYRSRLIRVPALGEGSPCAGNLRETLPCPEVKVTECTLGIWTPWTSCDKDCDGGQQFRTRSVVTADDGTCVWTGDKDAASVPLRDTRECNAQPCDTTSDCLLYDWSAWSPCSTKCGQGTVSRNRSVKRPASGQGQGCSGDLQELQECQGEECVTVDCKWGEWYTWSACSASCGLGTKRRSRVVVQAPRLNGALCEPLDKSEVKECEIQACDSSCIDALWAPWSDWSTCSTTCDEGFQERSRAIGQEANACGNPLTGLKREFRNCSVGVACVPDRDCELSTWGDWSFCSGSCSGVRERNRNIKTFASGSGAACEATALRQVEPCNPGVGEGPPDGCHDDKITDCEFSSWSEWTDCTRTCGGGQRSKSRVIQKYPKDSKAEFCNDELEHMEGCNTQPCKVVLCVDCAYSEWGEWGGCSHCGGQRYRNRHIVTMATSCGKACSEESLREVSNCTSPCAQELSCAWSDWSEPAGCEAGCGGASIRTRTMGFLPAPLPKAGKAKEIGDAVSVRRLEDPPAGLRRVHIKSKHKGSHCVSSSDGNFHNGNNIHLWHCGARKSHGHAFDFLVPEHGKGKIHLAGDAKKCLSLAAGQMHNGNNMQVWDCDALEDGRAFDFILPKIGEDGYIRMAADKSKCLSVSAGHLHDGQNVQVWDCDAREDGKAFDFSIEPVASSEENGEKGDSTRSSSDEGKMDIVEYKDRLFDAAEEALCTGTQMFTSSCTSAACSKPCEPQDCVFNIWGEWDQPGCLGICSRVRSIFQNGNECGKQCNGPLAETKSCEVVCDQPVDCVLGTWGAWGECDTPDGQKQRTRIIEVLPKNGGKKCDGALEQTIPCVIPVSKPCVFSEWGPFSECSAPCNGGFQTRQRLVNEKAEGDGDRCEGSLEELAACNTQGCSPLPRVDCTYSHWSAWSPCTNSAQKTRERTIVAFAQGGGKSCSESLSEAGSCADEPVDCEVSSWTAWDACDRTCGGGQQSRHRQVITFPRNKGKECPESLHESQGCNIGACPSEDCQFSKWSLWSPCTATCGVGQMERSRSVLGLRDDGGSGCEGLLSETRNCPNLSACPVTDCVWQEWHQWSGCTCTCGGGHRSRTRSVLVMPSPGGKACDAKSKEEVGPCNTQPCDDDAPVDGAWSEWTQWTTCSATCHSGVTSRQRKVSVMARNGGTPAYGDTSEVKVCNENISCSPTRDCEFTEWAQWGGCTERCNGVKHRHRSIASYGSGDGSFCLGALKEIHPCNPDEGEKIPEECEPPKRVDCEMATWSQWSDCSVTCGGGQHIRSRDILKQASGGGKPCEKDVSEVAECARTACFQPKAVDCVMGDWGDWSVCDKCGGEQRRFRTIVQEALHGGKVCGLSGTEEIQACPETCGDAGVCSWMDWDQWGACNARCGAGKRSRQRRLARSELPTAESPHDEDWYPKVKDAPKAKPQEKTEHAKADAKADAKAEAKKEDVVQDYERLRLKADALQGSDRKELVAAFAAGMLVVLAGMLAFRTFSAIRTSAMRQGYDNLQREMEMPIVE